MDHVTSFANASQVCETKNSFHKFLLCDHDHKIKFNNVVVGFFWFKYFWYQICNDVSTMKKIMEKWMIFEELYLLHPPSDFEFSFWDGFQLESSFGGRKLKLIQNVRKTWHAFQCKGSSFEFFSFVDFLAVFTIARSLFVQRIPF